MDSPKVEGFTATSASERRKKRVRVYKKRITLKWFLAILAFSVVISLALISLQGLFSSLVPEDTAYRPKDIEGRYHELQRMKNTVEKGAEGTRSGR
jgi:hypothetical protein